MVYFGNRKATKTGAYVGYAPLFVAFSCQNILIFNLG
jgi:hypothetical protein